MALQTDPDVLEPDALPAPAAAASPAPSQLAALGRERLPAAGPAHVAWWDGEQVRTVALEHAWTRIGRSLAADVQLDDPSVSRRHALLVRHHDGIRVHDDGSRNGVWVNGQRDQHGLLADGDVIRVGRHEVVFLLPTRTETAA